MAPDKAKGNTERHLSFGNGPYQTLTARGETMLYFISYVGQDPETGAIGFGSAEVWRDDPVRSLDDVKAVIPILERWGMRKITVLHWRRFEDESHGA